MRYTGCFSRGEIANWTPPVPKACLISIRDPGEAPAEHSPSFHSVLYIAFWDVEHAVVADRQPATVTDLRTMFDFIMEHANLSIVVNCEAGVSRSAAVREFLLRRGWAYISANQNNRKVSPNGHVLAGLERLDKGENYESAIKDMWIKMDNERIVKAVAAARPVKPFMEMSVAEYKEMAHRQRVRDDCC